MWVCEAKIIEKGTKLEMDNPYNEQGKTKAEQLEPGMQVEATEGDLGEADVSKPKIERIERDQNGEIEKVIVKKGVLFAKEIEIPAERFQEIKQNSHGPDTLVIKASEQEIDNLKPAGPVEQINQVDNEGVGQNKGKANRLLDEVSQNVPTESGLRKLELQNNAGSAASPTPDEQNPSGQADVKIKPSNMLKLLGPGFLAGMAGNDASAVTAYSVTGAKTGYGQLWLMLISTPLYQASQYACSRIGRITQKGLAEILRENYGAWTAWGASLILIIANIALIAADLVAVGSAIELLTGLSWGWFVLPVALVLWYITVYQNFEAIKKIFLILSLVFVTYLVTAVLSKPDWGQVLSNTFIPKLDFSFAAISSAVALLGATISPYNLFWQVQGEKEEKRPGSTKQQLRIASWDIGSGVISGNLIAYAIIVCTSATLFAHHQDINTAADAAKSLEPLLGAFAKYLFAFGLIGAGLIAIPILLASTSYAVAGSIGWPTGLSKKPWQSEGFYIILTIALVVGIGVALTGLDPIQLMFWANVLNGVLAPVLVILLILVGNNIKIMTKEFRLSRLNTLALIITAVIMIVATSLLFFGLLTGQTN